MISNNELSILWSDPLWWLNLTLLIGGSVCALLLSRKGEEHQTQQRRLSQYTKNNLIKENDQHHVLFEKAHKNNWLSKEASKLNNALQAAGFYHIHAIRYFLMSKLIVAICVFITTYSLFLYHDKLDTKAMWLCGIFAFLANIIFEYYLVYRRKKQKIAIIKALPDSLELLVICLESGATLERGLTMVSEQLIDVYPELSLQWKITLDTIKVNPDRQVALNDLAQRNQISEITALVTVLQQAEKFGSPLAKTLRNLSSEMRELKKLTVEEHIGKLSSRITLPTLILVFMPLLVIILAPQISMLVDALKGIQ